MQSNALIPKLVAKDGSQPLQVKHFKAEANIEGSLVSACYEQLFVNESQAPVELLYSVPLTETVTVTGLTIQLADREIECEIQGKEEAKEKFENAQARGQTGAIAKLKDEEEDKFLEVGIGAIQPGAEIKVKLNFLDTTLVFQDQFCYSFSAFGDSAYNVDLSLSVRTAHPIAHFASPVAFTCEKVSQNEVRANFQGQSNQLLEDKWFYFSTKDIETPELLVARNEKRGTKAAVMF